MKIYKLIQCCILLIFISVQAAFAQNNSKNYVADELLVKYKTGADAAQISSVNKQSKAEIVEELPEIGWRRVKLFAGASLDKALSIYKSSAEVEAVQPNFYYHLLNTPNDAQFGSLYGMQKISAPLAWDLTTGSAAVVVADIDTGLRYTHEDLAANAWRNPGEIAGNGVDDDGNGFVDDYYGWDFFYNTPDPYDTAGGHGTHTAGTIGAVGNNSLGVTGVNWNVKIMAIKIYSANGSDTTSAMLVNAYNYIRMMKQRGVNIRVTNNSYGGCGEACGYDQATKDALDAMGNAGILNVFAAGNSNTNNDATPFYPASYDSPSVLAVAASDSNDNKASFSSYGATRVDVAAPGVSIRSTWADSDSSYLTISGTSMATPHTAGAAALLSAYNPNLSAASLKATLMNTVDVLTQWNGRVKSGGRINVARAMQNQTVCNFTLDRTSQLVFAEGGTFTVNVTSPTNCDYAAVSGTAWLTVTGGNPGSASGTVTFNIPANSGAARNGTITIGGQSFAVSQVAASPNYEADVQSRPSGNGFIDADDVQQIRRYIVGLDQPYQNNEFQRADCAPRSTSGDGFVDADDVQQVRRFSVGTDSIQNAAGAVSPNTPAFEANSLISKGKSIVDTSGILTTPVLQIENQKAAAGQTITVPVKIDTAGNEAGYTFGVVYDSAKLSDPQVTIGSAGGDVVFNSEVPGQIGFSVTGFNDAATGNIAAGKNLTLVNITFTILKNAEAGETTVSFSDIPARRKAAGIDPNNPITQPIYKDAAVTINGAAASAAVTGRVTRDGGKSLASAQVLITGGNGEIVQTGRTNGFGYYRLTNLPVGETYTVKVISKQYKFDSQVISVTQNLEGVNFAALPKN